MTRGIAVPPLRPVMHVLIALAALVAGSAAAEPYFAVREGLGCSSCHANPTGGGLRNAYGNVYAQQQLPMVPLESGDLWTGVLADRFGFGANGRISGSQRERDDRDDVLDFGVDRVTLYGSAQLNDHVLLYVDQQVAPGGSANREAWVKFGWGEFYARAGRFFLPFGWRLEDNSAVIRSETGVNMDQGDDGVEIGWLNNRFEVQIAVANGNGGGAEVDDGKLFTGRLAWLAGSLQLGVSAFHNDTDDVDRSMAGVFGGLRTGRVTWLAEYDWIRDRGDALDEFESGVALLEANWLITDGNNLKATVELQHFDDDRDRRLRYSLVYELFPWSFTQIRAGVRIRDSDDPDPRFNAEEGFLEVHAYF